MLKRYRRSFVRLNMGLVGAVLLLMLAGVGVYMYHDYVDALRTTMAEVVKPLNAIGADGAAGKDVRPMSPTDAEGQPFAPPDGNDGRPPRPEGAGSREGINTFFYHENDGTVTILPGELLFDEDTLAQLAPVIVSREQNFGKLADYQIYYYYTGSGSEYKLAIAGTGYISDPLLRLIITLALIFVGVMLVVWLISRRVAALAVRPLEEAMRREKQFVADASHDLKTPLTVILANSSIMRHNPEATVGSQLKWLDNTEAAAKNMQSMVNDMLTLSRAEAQEAPALAAADFSSLAEKAVLQMESVAYDGDIALSDEISAGITVLGNEEYLERIAVSLIENALKYEKKGGEVRVRLAAEKGCAVLSVRNSGVIDPADLPHVFERFYRGDKARGDGGGHGLGLAITKQLTEAQHGTISVSSDPTRGTEFRVSFRIK